MTILYVARDKDEAVTLFASCPILKKGVWLHKNRVPKAERGCVELPDDWFPEVKPEERSTFVLSRKPTGNTGPQQDDPAPAKDPVAVEPDEEDTRWIALTNVTLATMLPLIREQQFQRIRDQHTIDMLDVQTIIHETVQRSILWAIAMVKEVDNVQRKG